MTEDSECRRGWVKDRQGNWRRVQPGEVLSDGESMPIGMRMADGRPRPMTTMTTDAQRSFEDAYGPGGACLAGLAERAKAQALMSDAKSNEVFRVEQAVSGLRNMAFRYATDVQGSDLLAAAFLTRMADEAGVRATFMRAGHRPEPANAPSAVQHRQVADARQSGGERAATYEQHKVRLSNAWKGSH